MESKFLRIQQIQRTKKSLRHELGSSLLRENSNKQIYFHQKSILVLFCFCFFLGGGGGVKSVTVIPMKDPPFNTCLDGHIG